MLVLFFYYDVVCELSEWIIIIIYIPETTLADYMYLERRDEEHLPASKTALTHRYNGSKTS